MKKIFIFLLKIGIIGLVYFGSKWYFSKNTIPHIEDFTEIKISKGQFFHSILNSPSFGEIPFCVYLPPNWKSNDTTTYPLLIYLYGQNGDEYAFSNNIPANQLNDWIYDKSIKPFVVLSYLGNPNPSEIQWFSNKNQTLLISNSKGELRDFCRKTFRAGMNSNQISLEGQSRGASGVLFYAFNNTEHFSSFIANAYVSDFTLDGLKKSIIANKARLQKAGFNLRIEIGDKDSFAKEYKRRGSQLLHEYLKDQNIPHEYEIIKGGDHWYRDFWNYYREEEKELNGLFHLKYHQKSSI